MRLINVYETMFLPNRNFLYEIGITNEKIHEWYRRRPTYKKIARQRERERGAYAHMLPHSHTHVCASGINVGIYEVCISCTHMHIHPCVCKKCICLSTFMYILFTPFFIFFCADTLLNNKILTSYVKCQSLSVLIIITSYCYHFLFRSSHLIHHNHFNSDPLLWVALEICTGWILLLKKIKSNDEIKH